jgi:large subunit ribosomal protein L17
MRHKRKTQNLSRFSSYYQATIRSIAKSVLIHQRIVTTKVRAKLARRLVDQLVTLGKEVDSLAARRRAFSFLNDHGLVHRLFSDIAPLFSEKKGGYTRIISYKRRRGDNAELVILELSMQKALRRPSPEPEEKAAKKEVPEKARPQTPAEKQEPKPVHPDIAPPDKEKHKKETKKPSKKIMGGIGKLFKTERDYL